MNTKSELKNWMIYGANGYTGKLIAKEAKKNQMVPILAGRSEEHISPLARELDLPFRIFSIDSKEQVTNGLKDIFAVVLAAGPFLDTSKVFVEACIETKTHYIDITGEIPVFEAIFAQSKAAQNAGIALLPGMGMDVVPTDCLARMLKEYLPSSTHIQLCVAPLKASISPGTAKTIARVMPMGQMIRKDGQIIDCRVSHATTFTHPILGEPMLAKSFSWGDVSTSYYSTQIPNVSVHMYDDSHSESESSTARTWVTSTIRYLMSMSWGQWLARKYIERYIKGPTEEQNEQSKVLYSGIVWDDTGKSVVGNLETASGYCLTAYAVVKAIEKLETCSDLKGSLTPSMAFGKDFVMEIQGSQKWDFVESELTPEMRKERFPF